MPATTDDNDGSSTEQTQLSAIQFRSAANSNSTELSNSLEANRFGQELAELDEETHSELVEESLQSAEDEFRERSTDSLSDYEGRLSDDVAAHWGTPKGDWWP